MKYKCIKSYPWVKEGAIAEIMKERYQDKYWVDWCGMCDRLEIEGNPEYRQKIENVGRWYPNYSNEYYWHNWLGEVKRHAWQWLEEDDIWLGNIYKTKEQAQAIIAHRKFCEEMMCKYWPLKKEGGSITHSGWVIFTWDLGRALLEQFEGHIMHPDSTQEEKDRMHELLKAKAQVILDLYS